MRISCCKDCPNRCVGCHGKCEKYIDEKNKYEKEKKEFQKYKKNFRGTFIKKGDFLGDDGQLKYFQYGGHHRSKRKK